MFVDLKAHFRKLLMPSNHFLIPLARAGPGDVPEVIDEVHKFESVIRASRHIGYGLKIWPEHLATVMSKAPEASNLEGL